MNKMIIEKTENGIYKMLDLSRAPKIKGGKIAWSRFNEHKIPFQWGSLKGYLVISYANTKGYVTITYKNNMRRMHRNQLLRLNRAVKKVFWFDLEFKKGVASFSDALLQDIVSEDKNKMKKLEVYSKVKVRVSCRSCSKTEKRSLNNLSVNHKEGFFCEKCLPTKSYPERLVASILKVNNIRYEVEKEFQELPSRRFDFYLRDYNMVIEAHGKQHLKDYSNNNWSNYYDIDRLKESFCIHKGIEYVAIDCQVSDFNYILQSCQDKMSFISDWNKRKIKDALERISYVNNLEVIRKYEDGFTSIELSKMFNCSPGKILDVLKQFGVNRRPSGFKSVKVVCLNNGIVFNQVRQASLYGGYLKDKGGVSLSCKNGGSAGKHPVTGEKLKWMYYEDYVEKYGTEGLTEYVEEEMHV